MLAMIALLVLGVLWLWQDWPRPAIADLPAMAAYILISVVLAVPSLLMVRHGWYTLITQLRSKTS